MFQATMVGFYIWLPLCRLLFLFDGRCDGLGNVERDLVILQRHRVGELFAAFLAGNFLLAPTTQLYTFKDVQWVKQICISGSFITKY